MNAAPLSLAIYLPNLGGGGVERMKINLSKVFLERGIQVTFVLHEAEGELIALVPPGVRVRSLGARRTIAALPALTRYLRNERPDVLLSSLGHNNINALWARRLAGVSTRVIVSQHNALTRESLGHGNWQHRALPYLYRAFLGLADGVVAVSKGVADDMAAATGIDRGRITVIYNPVLTQGLSTELGKAAPHPWLDDPSQRVFVAMGRLVLQKDFATLLRAMARVDRRLQPRLLILGEGPLRSELEALSAELGVNDIVKFMGFLKNPVPYVSRARALVMSSIYEGFGNVLVEALACGTPVVSTDCPYGPAEILDAGRFGRLVPVGDASALACAMEAVIESSPPPEMLRERAAEFDVYRVADRYIELFRTATKTTAAGRGAANASSPPSSNGAPPPIRSVAIYVPKLFGGGAEVSMARLAQGLTQAGIDVSILVHGSERRPSVNASSANAPSAEIIDLGVRRSIAAIPGLVRHLRERRPDVLVAALPHNNIVAVVARALARVPVLLVLTEHSPMSIQLKVMRERASDHMLPWILPIVYRHCDAVVAVSRGVRDDLARILGARPPRLDVIYNPVLPSNWRELAAEDVAHPWLAKGGPPVVLSVARLNEEKNLETFIRAFAKLHQRQPTVRLLMLGDGPERSKLEALVVSLGLQDAVELPGWVENPFPYMRRARVLVLASRFEGFGNVLVEAMACGTAVVSTDCPVGPSEILQGGRVGNLVPVGDEESLTRAIENAIEANGVRAGTVERALEFSVERSTEQYVALFRELRAGARRSTQRSARAAEH